MDAMDDAALEDSFKSAWSECGGEPSPAVSDPRRVKSTEALGLRACRGGKTESYSAVFNT